jgi:hypothetical protein
VTKDGLRDKVGRDLRRLYDDAAEQPVPADMRALLDKLK